MSQGGERREQAAAPTASRTRGLRFLSIGAALLVLGVVAIMLPDASTAVTGAVLGTVVALGGAFVVVQALRDTNWRGFTWQLLFGSVEVVGGILIVLNPLKGAAAITLLVVIVMAAQAVTQLGLALRIRPAAGWAWLVAASGVTGLFALGLALRFPYGLVDTPGEMAGIAMGFAGVAFVMIGSGWLKLKPGAQA